MQHILADGDPIQWLAKEIIGGALSALLDLWKAVLGNTEPSLTSGTAFATQYNNSLEIASYLVVPMVLVATIQSIFKGGLQAVLKLYLIAFPIALFGGMVAVAIVQILQAIDNNMTQSVVDQTNANFTKFANSVPDAAFLADLNEGGLILDTLFSFLMILGMILLWGELIVRALLLNLTMIFIPLAFAFIVWKPGRRWVTNLIELVIAVVFAKFIIVAVMGLGFAAMGAGLGLDNSGGSAFTHVGTFAAAAMILFLGCAAMPALVSWVMGPNIQLAGRRDALEASPLNMDRSAARSQAIGPALRGIKGAAGKLPGL